MAESKADRKERLRQERIKAEKRERAEQRRKLLLGYGLAGALTLLVIVGVVYVIANSGSEGDSSGKIMNQSGSSHGLTPDERNGPTPPEQVEYDLQEAVQKANCVLREDLPDEGNAHISPDDEPPKYKTAPPTSGDHIEPPLQQADGAYLDEADPVNWIHSLEHGRVAIVYSPDLPEDQQLELRGLYDELYSGALLFPYAEMPYDVAAVSWQNLIGCKQYKGAATLDAIRSFGEEHWGEGPEDVLAFGPLTGPTPAAPGQDPPDS